MWVYSGLECPGRNVAVLGPVSGVHQEQERHVLPPAGAELRPRQPRLVLHTAPQQVGTFVIVFYSAGHLRHF